jgi:hypothetical protein
MIYDSGDAEALRLLRAFHKISDPEARRIIVKIVQAAAQGATLKVKAPETKPHRDLG